MSSCPSPSRVCYYDVFLSFRGVDTRKTVVSHLYTKLVARGIPTFKDDRKIGLGDSIPDELRRSIQSSRFAIVVISPNYATSRWCLEELRLMMELELNNEIGVIPVFYNVVPSDVKNLRGKFALTGLRSLKMAEKIPKWRQALTRIGNLQGTESSKCKDDAAMIEEVVGHISSRLSSMLPMDLEAIDGMKDHMEGLRPLLRMDSKNDEVRMIGIWGMGGIGKTSIAKYLYERHKHQFSNHHCFLEGVSSKQHGLLYLQKQLLSNILGDEDLKLWNLDEGANLIKSRLRNLKALIVLDDVDDRDQLHFLAREVSWFGRGSRIIITTRDKSLLSSCNVYKVKCLNDDKALQLFQKIAFQGGKPPSRIYKDLSNRFSRIAQGLPLALETFGFYLRDKPLKQWQDALKSVEVTPYEKIMKVLKVSYDRLDKLGKTAFLHVACHFNGEPVQRVMSLLEQGEVRIRVLSEQSLIHISADGCIAMHHLLEQMGRQIVRQDSGNSPAHQLILWHLDDIYPVLEDKAGTSNIEGMVLDVSMLPVGFQIKWDVFKLMHNLRFLKIYKLSGGLDSCRVDGLMLKRNLRVPRKLRLLHWDAYPFTTLPSSITPDCLVELKLCYSKLTTLWSGAPDLLRLRRLDLTGSEDLRELPDLQKAVHLEELILEGCTSLKRIPKSICSLSRLQKLDVSNCDGLKELKIKITELKCTVLQGKSFRVRSVCINFYGVDPFLEDSQGISATNLSIKGNIKIELKRFGGFAEHLAINFEKQISPEELMMFELKSRF